MPYQPPQADDVPRATEPTPVGPEPLGPPPRRWNWRVMIVIFLIVIPLFVGIYLAWLAFTPPDPSGYDAGLVKFAWRAPIA